jgi:hypothetical protein
VNSSAPYVACGAHNRLGDILAYAYLVVERRRLQQVDARVAALRQWLQLPEDVPLGLARASLEDLQAMMRWTVRIINQERLVLRYAHADFAAWKAAYPSHEIEPGDAPEGSQPHLAPKGLLGTVARGCFDYPQDGSKGPPVSACEIVAAGDPIGAACLQLAGVAAHIVAQAVSAPGFFRTQLSAVKFRTGAELQPNPAVTPGYS